MNISLSPSVPENLVSRDGFGSPVPRQSAHLQTQAESGAYLRDSSRLPYTSVNIFSIICPIPSAVTFLLGGMSKNNQQERNTNHSIHYSCEPMSGNNSRTPVLPVSLNVVEGITRFVTHSGLAPIRLSTCYCPRSVLHGKLLGALAKFILHIEVDHRHRVSNLLTLRPWLGFLDSPRGPCSCL